MTAATDTRIADAEKATAEGRIDDAIQLYRQLTDANSGDFSLWLRLAALNRAAGKPQDALQAVDRALVIAPLDFMALLMRASLLDRLGSSAAGEAWDNALCQKPADELPPQVAMAVQQGERRRDEWLSARETRLAAAMAASEARADNDERERIARFRSNVLRRTRTYHSSPTHYHFPELPEREFHPRRLFPWIESLEAATETIAAELKAVMAAERAELVPYIDYADHLPLDQWRPLNRSMDWTAIHLLNRGERVDANARHCPRTMELLATFPQPDVAGAGPNAMFSLLAPNTSIPPHVGVNNTRLVVHLPLVVPDGCWFRVGEQTRFWERGKAFVFDDTIEHEALNPSDDLRIVFIFDVWNPALTDAERNAARALIEADPVAKAQPL